MILGLVWILGCYAAGIAIIHILHWRRKRQAGARMMHYILQTRNNGHQIEWVLRSLHFFSWMRGRAIAVTIADEGSTDDTVAIAERLSQEHHLTIYTHADNSWEQGARQHENEQLVIVRLNQEQELETAYKLI
ncbi:hypothetical protein SAMN02799630_05247 [Paenibacillus sp. UNCCL117]|uniref:hypothetical protein n=1 Tax=unclassified Paenibacillus TaxID=185978 RepID=UPI0008871D36|nr:MULTISPECIES: hypothetical protein [unclassified Paenibacillus]SDE35046.1 hypothetical protein SAMN04488602_12593 [Paenibacillus sp. cl123]SFW64422.1 hypothetical protein SAMN02799630_05247 [Paenibacillus sp. UNCCL117]